MAGQTEPAFAARFWQYQKERFPVFKHGALIAAFSSSAVCMSALLRGQQAFPEPAAFAVGFVVLFGLFLQLRISDEFKDREEDARHRPERAVPRGLVSLGELAWLGVAVAVIQVVAVAVYFPLLLVLLALAAGYMALMGAEFFVVDWLKPRPFVYMVSHMVVMPLIDLFATACDWLVMTGRPPTGLFWFLVVSFFNGVIIEIGRKTWAPAMERPGVESYSSAWGRGKAVAVWLVSMVLGYGCALVVAADIGFFIPVALWLGAVGLAMAVAGRRMVRAPDERAVAALENLSGLWVFSVYLALGIVPMGVAVWL